MGSVQRVVGAFLDAIHGHVVDTIAANTTTFGQGQVTAVNADGSVMVSIGADLVSVPATRLAHYDNPQQGDLVEVRRQSGHAVVTGAYASGLPVPAAAQTSPAAAALQIVAVVSLTGHSQTVANGTDSLTQYDTIVSDDTDMFDVTTHLFKVAVPGIYNIRGQTQNASGLTAGQIFAGLYVNATSGAPTLQGLRFPCGLGSGVPFSFDWPCHIGDTLGIDTWQSSGSPMVITDSNITRCTVEYISPL